MTNFKPVFESSDGDDGAYTDMRLVYAAEQRGAAYATKCSGILSSVFCAFSGIGMVLWGPSDPKIQLVSAFASAIGFFAGLVVTGHAHNAMERIEQSQPRLREVRRLRIF